MAPRGAAGQRQGLDAQPVADALPPGMGMAVIICCSCAAGSSFPVSSAVENRARSAAVDTMPPAAPAQEGLITVASAGPGAPG